LTNIVGTFFSRNDKAAGPYTRYTTALLGCGEAELLFGDSTLFINPTDADFSAGWHSRGR
jgi:hypothetical protein